jgi:TusE/DsrC/DsvC family sulfur relay protein
MEPELIQHDMLDGDGFLLEMSTWTKSVAEDLAERNDLAPLCEDHWRIIDYVREYYLAHGQGPPIVKISKATGMTSREICTLFPCGVGRGCFRLAGLPRPSGCL